MLDSNRQSKTSLLTLEVLFLLGGACSSLRELPAKKAVSRGDAFFQGGQYSEAAIEYRNAIQADSKWAAGHQRLGRTLALLHNEDSAIKELGEALALEPGDTEAALQLASLLIGKRDVPGGQGHLLRVLARDGKNARAHALLGESYAASREVDRAAAELRTAIGLDPRRIEYAAALGTIFLGAGRAGEAGPVFRAAVEGNPASEAARTNLAEFYLSQGEWVKATEVLGAAIQIGAKGVAPRLLLMRVHMAQGLTAQAERVAREVKNLAPDDPEAVRALSQFYVSTNQGEKAMEELRAILAARPADGEAKHDLARLLAGMNRPSEAEVLCQELESQGIGGPAVLLTRGQVLRRLRRYPEAAAVLQRAVQMLPSSAAAHYELGMVEMASGLPHTAKQSLMRARELDPKMSAASLGLARLASVAGEREAAAGILDAVAAGSPASAQAEVAKGQSYLAGGDLTKAAAKVSDALRADSLSLPALTLSLNIYRQQGKPELALQRFLELAKLHPNNAGLQFLTAAAYFNLSDFHRAEASVRKALQGNPRSASSYLLLGNIQLARGFPAEARSAFLAASEIDSRNGTALLSLANLAEREGDWKAAVSLCEKARAADPQSALAANQLAYLYLEHGGDKAAALSLAQEAKRKLPKSPEVADTLGWAYFKSGRMDPAIGELKECIRGMPGNAMCHYHLGMVYVGRGERDAAIQSLRQALKTPGFDQGPLAQTTLQHLAGGRL